MKRLLAAGVVGLTLASGGWPIVSASRMSRPDRTRLTYQRDVVGNDAYADAEWKIVPRGGHLGIIVGAAVCRDEAFLLDRQLAIVHRVDLVDPNGGAIVADLGAPVEGSLGLQQVASLTADCDGRLLYVVDFNGVSVIEMDSGEFAARFPRPPTFVNSIAATVLDAEAQVLYVPGLWPASANDWLVKPVDRMFEGDRLGYRLDLRTGQTTPMVPAVERGCWSLGPNCLFASLDRVSGSKGAAWVAAHVNGMQVGVYDSELRLVRNVDVRSPNFLETGQRNGSQALPEMVAWNEENSVIRDCYAFGDSIVTVHSFNRTKGWKPGQPTDFEVFMNVHGLDGTGRTSDIRLPDLPVGRDGSSLYVVHYGRSGRRARSSDAISLFRIPIDLQ
jgi:hypothetical protein